MFKRLLSPVLLKTYSQLTIYSNVPVINRNFHCVCSCVTEYKHKTPYLFISRNYAKGKDKKKEVKGKKVSINENELSEVLDTTTLYNNFRKPIDAMKGDFVSNLTLRTSAGALDLLQVTHDGTEYVLQDLAQISKKNPKTLVVNMSTFPQVIPDVLKAIEASGLGLNPQQDGTTLFIPVPKVTKEHRENLAKSAKTMFIKCRDAIRNVQNKAIKGVQTKEGVSEDTLFRVKEQLIILGDKHIAEAEQLMKTKQAELMQTES